MPDGAPGRPRILAELETERQHALNAFEDCRVAELDAQIARLSQPAAGNPSRETTSRPAAAARRRRQ
jgi:hypothetical protein